MDQAAKQQIVDRVKQAENVLVTVSANPSVDQLASCIGFTLLLNKMGKQATAVFSGKVPPVLDFLQPQKTLETNTDSLRDFIISLDKAKADKLRYKVEDEVVRIFITPYKTRLSDKDLVFSEGDFNVEVVIALGVQDRSHIDAAITAHGRILHDATVVSISAGNGKPPNLGQLNWQDPTASSLSEMLVSMSEAFGQNLIDNQTATAFLTGIVAETDRFSNKKTSPKVMTMSAQLMAAGANQQLVISKLEPPPPPPPPPAPKPAPPPPSPQKPKDEKPAEAKKPEPPKPPQQPAPAKKEDNGTLSVAHEKTEIDGEEVEIESEEIHIDKQGNLKVMEENERAAAKAEEKKAEEKPEEPKKEEPQFNIPPPPLPPPPPPITPAQPEPVSSPPSTNQGADSPLPLPEPPAQTPPPQAEPPLPPTTAVPVPSASGEPTFQLPPPPPIPQIVKEHPGGVPPPPPPAAAQAKPQAPAPEGPSHAFMDPTKGGPNVPGGFASVSSATGMSDYDSVPFDPLNGFSEGGSPTFQNNVKAEAKQSAPQTAPPPTQPADSNVNTARNAVEQAFAAVPFNPDLNPTASVGAQPMTQEVQTEQASVPVEPPPPVNNAEPSLPIPPSMATPSGITPPPGPLPPPVPPPILPTDGNNGPVQTPYGPMPPPSL